MCVVKDISVPLLSVRLWIECIKQHLPLTPRHNACMMVKLLSNVSCADCPLVATSAGEGLICWGEMWYNVG